MLKKILLPVFFIAGAATGATLGILYAPYKGKVTRAKLKAKIEEEKEQAEEKALHLEAKVRSVRNHAEDKLSHAKESLRHA